MPRVWAWVCNVKRGTNRLGQMNGKLKEITNSMITLCWKAFVAG